MGILGIPTRTNKGSYSNNGKAVHYKNRNYTNTDAVENLIHYVTRTRENEGRGGDLITYGAAGADYFHSVDGIIQQFRYVQYIYGINSRGGRRMYHEVLNLKDCELERLGNDAEILWKVGMGMLPGILSGRASGGICCPLGAGKAVPYPFRGKQH